MAKKTPLGALLLTLTLLCGCSAVPWQAQWQAAGKANPTDESRKLIITATKMFDQADSAAKLKNAMAIYQKVLEIDPGNYEALTLLGNQHILLGTAYTRKRVEKRRHFADAMKYCELAMYTNPAFRKQVDRGAKPWEAADELTAREAEAMLFWVTAVQYDFKEGMRLTGKIRNVDYLQYCLKFIDRIEATAPDFGGGAVEFAKGICYYALPESKGGNEEKGNEYMAKSMEKNPNWIFGRWARGKYFHKINNNDAARKADLEWVADAELDAFEDPYPWRVHFQADARSILGME